MAVQKIAILGGGPAALTAAFEITSQPNWKERYALKIYTLGWRLGGKCASSRNPAAFQRNEEHGLHVLGGFYHNTFQVLEALYAAWQGPIAFEDAFVPHDGYTVFDPAPGGTWKRVEVVFPQYKAARPGENPSTLTIGSIGRRLINFIRQGWRGAEKKALRTFSISPQMETFLKALGNLETYENDPEPYFNSDRDDEASNPALRDLEIIRDFMGSAPDFQIAENKVGTRGGLIRGADWGVLINMVCAVLVGLIRDKIGRRGFDSVNQYDALEWLKRHGAAKKTLESCYLQSGYHYAFAYVDGDPGKQNFAAGVALRGFLRMFLTYHGSIFFHMNGGMGEIFVTPFYEVLRRRGVEFAFFHRIETVETDGARITKVCGKRQAKVAAGGFAYEPLVAHGTRKCWPNAPKYELLENCPTQQNPPETEWDFTSGAEEAFALSADADFDKVILALPPGVLRTAAQPLAATSTEWRDFLGSIRTTPTIAAQLWHDRNGSALGAPKHGMITCYALPHSTWADMSLHIEHETRVPPVKSISYLCGPCPPVADATQETRNWLAAHGGEIFPKLKPGDERDFYARINSDPAGLYGLSPKGSVRYRPRADQTWLSNLIVAGDWTKNGMDVGAVEAAVLSGRLAARALTGSTGKSFPGEQDFG